METTPPAVSFSTPAAPPTLSDQGAWDIATAWQPQLQGKVRLEIDRDGPVDSIVETYAWVRIDDPRPLVQDQPDESRRREVVSILRAVMVTWSALAACPGYSGSENGVFWKRVISHLQPEPPKPPRTQPVRGCQFGNRDRPEAVTDTNGFFNLPGLAFPRFTIQAPYELNDAFTELFTTEGPELAPEVRAKMEKLLAQLKPHHRATHVPVVDICLRTYGFFGKHQVRALSTLVLSTGKVRGEDPAPHFRISHIKFRDSFQLSDRKQVQDFFNLTKHTSITFGHIDFTPLLRDLPPSDLAMWLQSFLRLDGHGVKATVGSFAFPRHYVDDAVFQALMSALPFATSTHSISFSTECMERKNMFQQFDLPWIAYAIFHPHAVESSWRHLTIERLILTEYSTHVLTAMARGNNLLALLNGTPPDNDAYFSAQLLTGAGVQREPNPASKALFTTPRTGVTVDLCGISSLDRATWGEWVAVIIPAYGLGWVRQQEIVEARTHSPAKQSLTGLRLQRNYNPCTGPTDDPPEALLHMLPPLGSVLKYLDISSYTDITASTLGEILRACPSLKVLVASHVGQLWSEPHSGLPQLEEIELSVYYGHARVDMPSLDHIQTSLRDLRALRLRVYDMQVDQLQASQATLKQLLHHTSTLRYLHWRNVGADYTWKRSDAPIPYDHCLEWTPRALTQLHLTDDKYLYAQEPLSVACVAAFLSVVADESERGASTLGRFVDRDVLATIFQFVTSPVKRVIHIEPNNKLPTVSNEDQ